ncbi:MAG TPA: chorismate mutase [Ignavibacteriaceae bacterium]|nr:chorismate mutase [Ignavibacteriaceae bacterium]
MDNLDKILNNKLSSLPKNEAEKLLIDLRDEIDKLDKSIVQLLNKRTLFAVYIGRVKGELGLPSYSPEREKEIAEKINSYLEEPLTKLALQRIYERIVDESRAIQKEEGARENTHKKSSK